MVFDRPNRPNPANRPNPPASPQRSTHPAATARGGPSTPQRQSGGGGNRNANSGNGGGGNPEPPSPWLVDPPKPDPGASFVEYLRWMRAADHAYKDPTKVQMLQMATERGDYRDRLQTLTERTKLIAGDNNWFEVQCPWRIRVGGHRGPESILLPAFDALGMPYIPSSTLRGVARTQGIRHFMKTENLKWKEAEQKIAPYFGSLEAEKGDRAGKVIFLDAYPLPKEAGKAGGLAMDMVNNIWAWDNSQKFLTLESNPNSFLSLKNSVFVIGIRPTRQSLPPNEFKQIRDWLIQGLASGVGSQINAGYGRLHLVDNPLQNKFFFEINFLLTGQLIHGTQPFSSLNQLFKKDRQGNYKRNNGKLVPNIKPEDEVRSTAFKSVLRYWFRAFALGFFPSQTVRDFEAQLFGTIDQAVKENLDHKTGLIRFEVLNTISVPSNSPTKPGRQEGVLALSFSDKGISDEQATYLTQVMKSLTWIMFHLGGVGQGARRPCYSRRNSPNPNPPWRGSTLKAINPPADWKKYSNISEFQKLFQQKIQLFYVGLGKLANMKLRPQPPSKESNLWHQVINSNSRVIVCSGSEIQNKPYALGILHQDFAGSNGQSQKYHPQLCGTTHTNPVLPSPVWIAAPSEDFQVVTVFEAHTSPRKDYIKRLRKDTAPEECLKIWPLKGEW
ncbi:RAMP superfamily CRISPR-associated protein [Lyngbya confervoides]|uniref:RAMP superfamily CRISPR-associated protein n=1 Tax=Lyngbya confervoides BDU141951 TaxID=1574623 RepID=A0ABD4T2W6_9CYAN|nr:RAMP superfamily CRISPR-associated protein [Lyngbya confervoides]MCM1982966.1 RAMP superfamily CRISPR-associated protein [Lyngbya confervoides BDU141951]